MEALELRQDLPDILPIVVQATSIVGLLERLVRVATSHVPDDKSQHLRTSISEA